MSRLYKVANAPKLRDFINPENYDYVYLGDQVVNVNDIVGMAELRNEEYNSDFTPKNEEDPRWLYQKELVESGGEVEPIPLVQLPDGKYVGDGDGSHRISVCKTLGVDKVNAKVHKMIIIDSDDVIEEDLEVLKNKIDELKQEHTQLTKEINEIQDTDFDKYHEVSDEYYSKIDKLNDEIVELTETYEKKEHEYKLNYAQRKPQRIILSAKAHDWVKDRAEHLIEVTDMPDGMCWGVAWKQWKKDNPGWKSKEEKAKKTAAAGDFESTYRTCAIVYMNGEFFEAEQHSHAIDEYLKSKGVKEDEIDNVMDSVGYETDHQDVIDSYFMADKIDDNMTILIIEGSNSYITPEECMAVTRQQYPEYEVIWDDEWMEKAHEYMTNNTASRLKKVRKMFGLYQGDCDNMLMFIDGDVIEGVDPMAIKMQYEKKYNTNEYTQIGKAYVLNKRKAKEVYIETDSLENVTVDEFAYAVQNTFPGALIFDNNNFEEVKFKTQHKRIAIEE